MWCHILHPYTTRPRGRRRTISSSEGGSKPTLRVEQIVHFLPAMTSFSFLSATAFSSECCSVDGLFLMLGHPSSFFIIFKMFLHCWFLATLDWGIRPHISYFCYQVECHVVCQLTDWSETLVQNDTCQISHLSGDKTLVYEGRKMGPQAIIICCNNNKAVKRFFQLHLFIPSNSGGALLNYLPDNSFFHFWYADENNPVARKS